MAVKKVFLSLPMRGRSDEEIQNHLNAMKDMFVAEHPDIECNFVDNFDAEIDESKFKNITVAYLAEAIKRLADCDYIYFGKGFDKANGCVVEDYIAAHYCIERFYEDESEQRIIELKEDNEEVDKEEYAKSAVKTILELESNVKKYVDNALKEIKETYPKVLIRYHKEEHPDLGEVEEHGNFIDLRCAEETVIPAHSFAMIDLGVSMKIPKGFWGQIVPRSSTFKKYHIIQTNSFGVIDTEYCGDGDVWKLPVFNPCDEPSIIPANERICQFRIVQDNPVNIVTVEKLEGPDRGGFGSTDKK